MRIVAPAAAGVWTLVLSLLAFREGPLPYMTGGFGDASCHSCHLDNPVNAPGGTLKVEGIPDRCQPGQRYAISVVLSRDNLKRGGFEIAARFRSGRTRGRQAGTWRPLDDRVKLQPSKDGRLQFAQHTTAGTLTHVPGTVRWAVEWTAPPLPGDVQFNTAANASNNDNSPLGDFIYLNETTCTAAVR